MTRKIVGARENNGDDRENKGDGGMTMGLDAMYIGGGWASEAEGIGGGCRCRRKPRPRFPPCREEGGRRVIGLPASRGTLAYFHTTFPDHTAWYGC